MFRTNTLSDRSLNLPRTMCHLTSAAGNGEQWKLDIRNRELKVQMSTNSFSSGRSTSCHIRRERLCMFIKPVLNPLLAM